MIQGSTLQARPLDLPQSLTPPLATVGAVRGDGAAAAGAFRDDAQRLATEQPAVFAAILRQTYGDKLSPGDAADLTQRVAAGDIPMPASVRFVDSGTLNGALGAYSAEGGGTVFLDAKLASDPATLAQVLAQEIGHHLDAHLGGPDTAGDEGRAFAMALGKGAPLSPNELAAAHAVPDTGTIRVDGKEVAVEFALPAILIWLGQGAVQTVPDALIGAILQQLTGVPYTWVDKLVDFGMNLIPGAGQLDTAKKLAKVGEAIDKIVDAARLADKLPKGLVGRADALTRRIGEDWAAFQKQVGEGDFSRAATTWGALIGKIREMQVASKVVDNGATLVDIGKKIKVPGGNVEIDLIFEQGGRKFFGEVKTGSDVMLREGSDKFQKTVDKFIQKRDLAQAEGAGFRVFADDISPDMARALKDAGIDVVRNGDLLR